jgi:hypothetical protein
MSGRLQFVHVAVLILRLLNDTGYSRLLHSGNLLMQPIKYQVVGEEDYAFVIIISSSGEYTISSGTYTSEPPRSGKLTQEQEDALVAAIHALGIPAEHPMPEGAADAFKAKLTIGEGSDAVTYPFWEGALEEDSKLLNLVRLLELL